MAEAKYFTHFNSTTQNTDYKQWAASKREQRAEKQEAGAHRPETDGTKQTNRKHKANPGKRQVCVVNPIPIDLQISWDRRIRHHLHHWRASNGTDIKMTFKWQLATG